MTATLRERAELPWELDTTAQRLVAKNGAMTLAEVAEYLGVTKEAVRQVEERALRKLFRAGGQHLADVSGKIMPLVQAKRAEHRTVTRRIRDAVKASPGTTRQVAARMCIGTTTVCNIRHGMYDHI